MLENPVFKWFFRFVYVLTTTLETDKTELKTMQQWTKSGYRFIWWRMRLASCNFQYSKYKVCLLVLYREEGDRFLFVDEFLYVIDIKAAGLVLSYGLGDDEMIAINIPRLCRGIFIAIIRLLGTKLLLNGIHFTLLCLLGGIPAFGCHLVVNSILHAQRIVESGAECLMHVCRRRFDGSVHKQVADPFL